MRSVTPGQLSLVDVLRRLGVELERGEDDDLRLRHEGLRLLDRELDLALLERRVLRPEGDHDALGLILLGLGLGLQRARARERLDAGEVDALPALAADAGLQQLVAPVALPRGLARAGDRLAGGLRRAVLKLVQTASPSAPGQPPS